MARRRSCSFRETSCAFPGQLLTVLQLHLRLRRLQAAHRLEQLLRRDLLVRHAAAAAAAALLLSFLAAAGGVLKLDAGQVAGRIGGTEMRNVYFIQG